MSRTRFFRNFAIRHHPFTLARAYQAARGFRSHLTFRINRRLKRRNRLNPPNDSGGTELRAGES